MILSDDDDAEEVTRLIDRVVKAMRLDWSLYRGEDRDAKAEEIMDMVDRITRATRSWSRMSVDELREQIAQLAPAHASSAH